MKTLSCKGTKCEQFYVLLVRCVCMSIIEAIAIYDLVSMPQRYDVLLSLLELVKHYII